MFGCYYNFNANAVITVVLKMLIF